MSVLLEIRKLADGLCHITGGFDGPLKLELPKNAWDHLVGDMIMDPHMPLPGPSGILLFRTAGGWVEIRRPPSNKELWPDVVWC